MSAPRAAVRMILLAALATLVLGLSAQAAVAGQLLGELRNWSPRGDASTSGWTTMIAAENLGSGQWASPVSFKADNDKTAFYDTADTPGTYVRVSRNEFFRRVGAHHAVDIRWAWKKSGGAKYRYVKTIKAIVAGA